MLRVKAKVTGHPSSLLSVSRGSGGRPYAELLQLPLAVEQPVQLARRWWASRQDCRLLTMRNSRSALRVAPTTIAPPSAAEPMPTLDNEPLRDAAYVAARLSIPEKSVLQHARQGRLPCVRIGKHVRFVMSEVERAILDARAV